MNSMLKNKRNIWLSKRDTSVEYERYETPVLRKYNFKANSKEDEISNVGELGVNYLIIKDTSSNLEEISIGDKFYMHEVNVDDFVDTAIDADFIVVSKDLGLDFGVITIKSLVGNFEWK